MGYQYRGNEVFIPRGAEIFSEFRPHDTAPLRDVVQAVLDGVEPWEQRESPIETFDLPHAIGAAVVKLAASESPIWGVSHHHRARKVGLSPLIRLDRDDERSMTSIATLELKGSVLRPFLTRVYPGDYMPPLPWMGSAREAPGGKEECLKYWSNHALVVSGPLSRISSQPPAWYREAQLLRQSDS